MKQLLKTRDYVGPAWQSVEVLHMLPYVTAPAFIQSGYFDFMVQVISSAMRFFAFSHIQFICFRVQSRVGPPWAATAA
jgi:hypothetical protein